MAGGLAEGGHDRRPRDDLRTFKRCRFSLHPAQLARGGVGLFALLRNEGGSVGTSMGQTITERRETFHALRLNEHLDL